MSDILGNGEPPKPGPENIEGSTIEVVELRQSFAPFEEVAEVSAGGRTVTRGTKKLALPGVPYPIIAFSLSDHGAVLLADVSSAISGHAITPFTPELGYKVTPADQDPAARQAKLDRVPAKEQVEESRIQNPLWLSTVLNLPGAESDFYRHLQQHPEVYDTISGLRLQLTFPTSTYEAQASTLSDRFQENTYEEFMRSRQLFFGDWYPVEPGRLHPRAIRNHGVSLPRNMDQLKLIKAKFLPGPAGPPIDWSKGPTPDNFTPLRR